MKELVNRLTRLTCTSVLNYDTIKVVIDGNWVMLKIGYKKRMVESWFDGSRPETHEEAINTMMTRIQTEESFKGSIIR